MSNPTSRPLRVQREHRAVDDLRWLVARLDQVHGDSELLDEALALLQRHTQIPDAYSTGQSVWTIYGTDLNRYLNPPPTWTRP